ncbi:MAG: hypothetical protein FWE79_00465, partial [Firmicutes bacterium]|nr:hypothetical protein [Bacillota bacterium]
NNAALIQDIQINVRHNNTQFKYLLMPIYVATFNHKGKAQNLFVNGESGKVVGRLPKGSKKVAGAIIGGALLAAAGVLIYLFASGILG